MAYKVTTFKPSKSLDKLYSKSDNAQKSYEKLVDGGYSIGRGGLGDQIESTQNWMKNLDKNRPSLTYKYQNQKKLNKALNNVANRKPFEYDLSDDQLFQTAKEQYQTMGRTAMADTIGQASAMTGGYGNSYATSAGNQAYNAYLQELNKSIGDYYSMALNTYNTESDRLNNILAAYQNDKVMNSDIWQAENSNWLGQRQLASNDYQNYLGLDNQFYQDNVSNAAAYAGFAGDRYNSQYNNEFNTWNASESNKQAADSSAQGWQKIANDKTQAEKDLAYKYTALNQSANEAAADRKFQSEENSKDRAVKLAAGSSSSGSSSKGKTALDVKKELEKNGYNKNSKYEIPDLLKEDIERLSDLYGLSLEESDKLHKYYGLG